MHQIILSIGFGIVTASILSMGAVGFTLQFGVTNLFNLAYGDVMTIGAFVAYLVHNDASQSIWVAMAAGGAAGMVSSVLIARVIYLPFMQRGTSQFAMVMVTVAVGIILNNVLQIFSGASFYGYALEPQESIHILGMIFTPRELIIIAVAALCMIGMHVLFKYTRVGKAMRATSDDASLARTCGIPTQRVVNFAWLASGLLCGLAGVALAMDLGTFSSTTGGSF